MAPPSTVDGVWKILKFTNSEKVLFFCKNYAGMNRYVPSFHSVEFLSNSQNLFRYFMTSKIQKKHIVHLKPDPLPTTYAYMSGQRFETPSKNNSK